MQNRFFCTLFTQKSKQKTAFLFVNSISTKNQPADMADRFIWQQKSLYTVYAIF